MTELTKKAAFVLSLVIFLSLPLAGCDKTDIVQVTTIGGYTLDLPNSKSGEPFYVGVGNAMFNLGGRDSLHLFWISEAVNKQDATEFQEERMSDRFIAVSPWSYRLEAEYNGVSVEIDSIDVDYGGVYRPQALIYATSADKEGALSRTLIAKARIDFLKDDGDADKMKPAYVDLLKELIKTIQPPKK